MAASPTPYAPYGCAYVVAFHTLHLLGELVRVQTILFHLYTLTVYTRPWYMVGVTKSWLKNYYVNKAINQLLKWGGGALPSRAGWMLG